MKKSYTEEELEELAIEIRDGLGFGRQEPVTAHDLLSRAISRSKRLTVRVMDDSTFGSSKGRTLANLHEIRFPRTTMNGIYAGDLECGYIAAEELSHYFLGHDGPRDNTAAHAIDHRASLNPEIDIEERDAKYLARALFAPLDVISEKTSASEVSNVFNLPFDEASTRLADVQAIRRRKVGLLRIISRVDSTIVSLAEEAEKRGRKLKNTVRSEPQDNVATVQKCQPYTGMKCQDCSKLSVLEDELGNLFCSECDWPQNLEPRS